MKITPTIRTMILSALKEKDLYKVALTEHLGKPKNYTTKLFNGSLKNISDEDVEKIEQFLDVRFSQVTEAGRVSDVAVRLTRLMDGDERLAAIFTRMVDYLENPNPSGAIFVTTGEQILKITDEWNKGDTYAGIAFIGKIACSR